MTWTTTPPSEPGWYWLRESRPYAAPEVVLIAEGDGAVEMYRALGPPWELAELLRLGDSPPQWAGPIDLPREQSDIKQSSD